MAVIILPAFKIILLHKHGPPKHIHQNFKKNLSYQTDDLLEETNICLQYYNQLFVYITVSCLFTFPAFLSVLHV